MMMSDYAFLASLAALFGGGLVGVYAALTFDLDEALLDLYKWFKANDG